MVGDLLDLTSLKRGEVRPRVAELDPRAPIREALAAVTERKKGVLLIAEDEGGPPLPAIRSDGRKLARLLTALVHNAVKFTECGEVRLSVELRDDRVVYRVTDTGVGISADAQQFVFDEFRQEDGSA